MKESYVTTDKVAEYLAVSKKTVPAEEKVERKLREFKEQVGALK